MRLQRIMLATDFSPQARVALDYAVELSQRLGAPLLLLAAFQIPIYPMPDGVVVQTAASISDLMAQTTSDVAAVKAMAVELGAHGVETVVVEGNPAAEIVRIAKEQAIDLIVVGSHGRAGISRAIVGSTADKVVRTAPCPVMVITHDPAETAA